MRILFFNYEFPPLGGGAGNASSYLLHEYAKIENLEVDFITSSVDTYHIEQYSKNIRIHFLDIDKKGNIHFQSQKDLLVYSWKSFWYARKLIKEKRYDLAHAFFGIPCGFIAMLLGLPYIVSLRGSDVPFYNERFYILDNFLFKYLSKLVWKRAFSVIALSYDLISIARKTSKKAKIGVIYNGINIEEFFPDEKSLNLRKTFDILFVGRLIPRKGLNYLLEAFLNISREYPQARLSVAGDGPLKNEYMEYVKTNSIDKKVTFLGAVSHDKLAEIYRSAHVFVLPSLNEALGNVTQEALASGLPIITTPTGAAEIIGEAGMIVAKKSASEIEKCIKKIIKDEKLRTKMAQKSRELALSMSWEITAKKYIDIYGKIVNVK